RPEEQSMRTRLWVPSAAATLLAIIALNSISAQTIQAHETLMGPTLASPGVSARTFMSEDGEHLAIVTAKGSRQVVLLDGVEGPVFDEIPQIFLGMVSVSVQWSPTGGHSAYLGRRGGDVIAVVDGKEAVTVSSASTGMAGATTGWGFWFNR